MKAFFSSLYGKISAVFLFLLAVLGIIYIWFSVSTSMDYVRESDQMLNRELAANLAQEFKPYLTDSLDTASIEHTMHTLMVMNPRVEIYLLDAEGTILAFFAHPKKKVELASVGLGPVQEFIAEEGNMPILGDDPRNRNRKKPFSAAPIQIGKNIDGFIYVILGGEQYDTASDMVRSSFIFRTTAVSLALTLFGTAIVGLVAFSFLTKRFRRMTEIVRKFERGDLSQRIESTSTDEIGQLANAFDQMADTIVKNMETLQQNDQMRRELVANVSHDLRSPLASIQGYLETILMKDGSLTTEERKKYLQTIFTNTARLSKLVAELFELSKYDARQVEPKLETFSIAELAQDVVVKFRPQASEKNIDLQSTLPKDLPMVRADIGMIERALCNLIENALRYTPPEGKVLVDLAHQNGMVTLRISDTGCGISDEELPRVFDRFYRVEKSRDRASGGTGLGLAIAKKILDLHESTITVESELEKGTTFSFDLHVNHWT